MTALHTAQGKPQLFHHAVVVIIVGDADVPQDVVERVLIHIHSLPNGVVSAGKHITQQVQHMLQVVQVVGIQLDGLLLGLHVSLHIQLMGNPGPPTRAEVS